MHRIPVGRSFDLWRSAARRLAAEGVPPENVWFDPGEAEGLFDAAPAPPPSDAAFTVPKSFLALAKSAADHRDADRWQLLYRLLWRLRGDPRLMANLTDPDVRRLGLMAKAVGRDVHKMHAFVRFRKIEERQGDRYVAFHRPDHFIVRRAAPFFRDRFGGMRWAILTPDDSVSWDGKKLTYSEGVESALPDGDSLEAVWKTYYANIFNPARIKVAAMKNEMPVRHWRTLPETELIPELLADAARREKEMISTARQSPALEGGAIFLPPVLTLPTMREALNSCRGCDLCSQPGVTQPVFGEGPPDAACVIVGEQPGDSEDRAGRPFVGPAGQLLDEMLAAAGVDRSAIYLTNTVKHFRFEPNGMRRIHRKPLARHVSACKPWLEAEVSIVEPRILVALGSTAAQAVMGRDFRVTRDRGVVMPCPLAPKFLATIHPSAILRMPDEPTRAAAREAFVADLRTVARELTA